MQVWKAPILLFALPLISGGGGGPTSAANSGSPGVFLLFLILTIIAVVRANKRWRTVLIIGAWMLAGFSIGAVTGYILGSLAGGNRGGVAGTLAGFVMWLGGLMGALRCILNNRRARAIAAKR